VGQRRRKALCVDFTEEEGGGGAFRLLRLPAVGAPGTPPLERREVTGEYPDMRHGDRMKKIN